jgi:hypothetical protein
MLKQYRIGPTYYGFDVARRIGIAFSTEMSFRKYFAEFDHDALRPPFYVGQVNANPDRLLRVKLLPWPVRLARWVFAI